MEHQLWQSIVAVLAKINKARRPSRFDFSDEDIVKVYYWSVIHDRPISWACDPKHWPLWHRRMELPSPSTISRRLRSPSVGALLNALADHGIAPRKPGLYWMIDGKPLTISGCSQDRQAGYGRAANCKAKGYKIHAIVDSQGGIAAWRLAPMNQDERVIGARLLRTAPIQGYVMADSNYDSNKLHAICDQRENLQLVTRRRYGPQHGTGHRKQTAGRLRSMQLTESPFAAFANQLLRNRDAIERQFGNLTSWGGGLMGLPSWVRTYRRVYRWVQAKLVLASIRRSFATRTYAA